MCLILESSYMILKWTPRIHQCLVGHHYGCCPLEGLHLGFWASAVSVLPFEEGYCLRWGVVLVLFFLYAWGVLEVCLVQISCNYPDFNRLLPCERAECWSAYHHFQLYRNNSYLYRCDHCICLLLHWVYIQ